MGRHKDNSLSEQQKRFADFYIELGVGTQAALKAGYAKSSAKTRASILLNDQRIKDYIADRMKTKESERIASQDEVLEFLTSVMKGQVAEQIPLLAGDGFQELRSLDSAQVKDRVKAAELLGKRYALWTEKKEVGGTVGVTIVNDLDE